MKYLTCGGCVSLRTLCFTIGIAKLIIAVILLIILSIAFAYNWTVDASGDIKEYTYELQLNSALFNAHIIVCMIIFVIFGLISVLHIIGTYKKNANYLLPAVCVDFTSAIINFLFIISIIATVCSTTTYEKEKYIPFPFLAFWITLFVLQIYLWMVIHNFYMQIIMEKLKIKIDNEERSYLMQPQRVTQF